MILIFGWNRAYAQPSARFTATQTAGCVPSIINFTDQSTGNPNSWTWDLGNGTVSSLQNPSVAYLTPGQYTVKLVVRNAAGSDSLTKINFITIRSNPSFAFTSDRTVGCYPQPVSFAFQPAANQAPIRRWEWDFGDGQLSTQQNPNYTYTQSGSFNVTLKVTDSNGCVNSLTRPRMMTVNGVKARFSSYVFNRCLSTRVNFNSTSTGNGTFTYQWSMGDGNSSTLPGFAYDYVNGGTYTAKLKTTNSFGCVDSVSVVLRLDTMVSASFKSNVRTGCRPPLNVSFSSPPKSGNTYKWEFGDGTISNQANPTHLYNDTGSYSVKLKVTNPNGCVDSLKINRYIQVKKPFIYIDNLPDSSCIPFTKDFYAWTNEPDDTIARYRWDFGNGSYSTAPAPLQTFRQAGYYNIRLIATTTQGCTDTAYFPNGIKVSTKPRASFTADNLNVCGKTAISFNNQSTGADRWQWEFGGGGGSTSQSPSYKFQDTGWLRVRLIAYNGGCGDTMTRERYVYIRPAIAKFSFTNSCINYNKVRFTNLSKGANERLWSFGDGDTSTALNPEHSYRAPGTYTVTLWVRNTATGCDHEFSKDVTVLNVSSSFTARQTSVCRGGAITFDCTTDSPKISRLMWDFGDQSGLVQTKNLTVTHVYDRPGTYTVKLIAISLVNCRDTIVRSNYIRIDGPTAKFGPGSYGACIGKPLPMLDSSLADGRNPIVGWSWDYGDSTPIQSYTAPPFTHTYDSLGTYFIALKVTDSRGCADSVRLRKPLRAVRISSQILPGYSFTRCDNSPFTLQAPFAEAGFSYRWNMGDGTSATTQNITKRYTNTGVYDISLVITNNAGCSDTTLRPGMITIVNTRAKFSINDSFRTCPPLLVNFSDSSANVVSKVWDFGDSTSTTSNNPSHFYSYPGNYTAKLTVSGPGGCVDTFVRRIVVNGPRGQITSGNQRSCRPYLFSLGITSQDAVSYTWDFNDGNTLNTTQATVSHEYQNSGTYFPRVMLVDAAGCKVPIVSSDTLLASTITAGFRMETRNSCDTGLAKFINTTSTNDLIAKYYWSFGDGTSSSLRDAQHRYAHDGTYSVTLVVVTRTGCSDSLTLPVTIKRVPPPGIRIGRSANGCAPLQVQFQGIRSATDTGALAWKWQFGNGDSSTLQNPSPKTFTQSGRYFISLSAVNSVGCKTTVTDTVTAFEIPVVKAPADTNICLNRSIVLTASGATSYEWSGNGLSCTQCVSTTVTPLNDALFMVKGISANGCFGRDTVRVNINRPAKLVYHENQIICKGTSKRLVVSGATNYQWSPATGLSSTSVASPVASPLQNITYQVVGNVNNACGNDTGYIHVKVAANPTVEAGPDKTIAAGNFVNLDPVVSPDVTEAFWTPTDELSRNGDYGVTVRPTKNTDYSIEVRNADGCIAKDKVAITLTCTANNIFIPNTFSPNNDGMNDIFFIRGIGLYKVRSLRIFNRWGEMVFSKYDFMANDPAMGWDGRYKGARLLTDVFVYIAEIVCGNGTVIPYNGNISLVN